MFLHRGREPRRGCQGASIQIQMSSSNSCPGATSRGDLRWVKTRQAETGWLKSIPWRRGDPGSRRTLQTLLEPSGTFWTPEEPLPSSHTHATCVVSTIQIVFSAYDVKSAEEKRRGWLLPVETSLNKLKQVVSGVNDPRRLEMRWDKLKRTCKTSPLYRRRDPGDWEDLRNIPRSPGDLCPPPTHHAAKPLLKQYKCGINNPNSIWVIQM